jgi:2'-5' RNA ligase/GNAT superfamily N-acetyltransferase
MATRHRLLVAALIGGAVATEIDGLRRALGSSQLGRIPPHVTLVPPTNVAFDALTSAEQVVRETAGDFEPLRLTLGPPATFPDNPSVLFLPVQAADTLTVLKEALFRGPFAGRDRLERAFIPHVTLDSRREPFVDDRLLRELAGYTNVVELTSLALLEHDESSPARSWTTLTSYDLAEASVVGRGGLEVHMRAGTTLSPSVRILLGTWYLAASEPATTSATEYFALASVSSEVVAAATWTIDGDVVVLTRHVVAPSWRGAGVGTSLLSFAERLERARGRRAIVLGSGFGDVADEYYLGRGYRHDVRLVRVGAGASALTRLL